MPAGGIRYFNFAPADAPDFGSFIKVSGESLYDKRRGFGWLDVKGPLEKGKWPEDEFQTWEERENLNLICRKGPDDLARSFFAGPATFALDLKPGKYEIWLLTGDNGQLEFTPYEPYQIIIEGVTAYDYQIAADEYYRQFETPFLEDDLTPADVWLRYLAPRFRWITALVDVEDGQLTVRLDGERRAKAILDYIGDYAITEIRDGPKHRFSGALNALVVLPAAEGRSGRQTVEEIDAWRRENFADKWPLKSMGKIEPATFSATDQRRGYTVFFPHAIQPAKPEDRGAHTGKALRLRGTPGEYVPITFGICPLKDLGLTRTGFHEMHQQISDGGAITLHTAGNLSYGVVRYAAEPTGSKEKSWRPVPAMIVPTDSWDILDGVTKQFWLTYRIPEGTPSGIYRGDIRISPEKADETTIEVELDVLPFRLLRPTHLAVGMTYFSPVHYAYFGEERFWKRMEAEFSDMRAHNMTSIQYTGIRMDDYQRLDRAFSLYRAAGFEHPVYLLESYGAMCRLKRDGVAWDTDEFHAEFVRFIREFLEEAKRRNWPPIIINFGDEFTNMAIEEFGARVARNLKTIPGIVTGADTNGYKEVALMAPEVDIVAFTNGWEGPNGVNRGKKLLKKETVDLIKKAGATPWLVNVGIDRFSNGYWFWKMIQLGVRGKMEWIYRDYNGMPFNSFDASPRGLHIVHPGPDGTAVPSLRYEWMRMGLDDLAYLYTLERMIDEGSRQPEKEAAASRANQFLKELANSIEDDMNKYRGQNGRKSAWNAEQYEVTRNKAIELIMELQ